MTNDGKCLSLRSTVYLTCEHRGPMLRSCSNQVSRPSGFSAGGGAPLLRLHLQINEVNHSQNIFCTSSYGNFLSTEDGKLLFAVSGASG